MYNHKMCNSNGGWAPKIGYLDKVGWEVILFCPEVSFHNVLLLFTHKINYLLNYKLWYGIARHIL